MFIWTFMCMLNGGLVDLHLCFLRQSLSLNFRFAMLAKVASWPASPQELPDSFLQCWSYGPYHHALLLYEFWESVLEFSCLWGTTVPTESSPQPWRCNLLITTRVIQVERPDPTPQTCYTLEWSLWSQNLWKGSESSFRGILCPSLMRTLVHSSYLWIHWES